MLTESDVIAAVCRHLRAQGYEIRQCLTETQRGDDIIALRDDETLLVEAKGETSSKSGSARHGQQFSRKQVHSHVAKALHWAAKARPDGVRVGIALPRNPDHELMVAPIRAALTTLGVTTYWVSSDGAVSETG